MKHLVLCAVVISALSGVAGATPGQFSHARSGVFAGFGFGAGAAQWDWGPSGPGSANERSGTFHLRLGAALRDDLVVGYEGSVWAKRWDVADADGELGELTLRVFISTVAITFFPANAGVYLRAGVGFGRAVPHVGSAATGFSPSTESGFAALAGLGYEWRISDKFAIGPEIQLSHFVLDGDWFQNPMLIDGSIQLNWYR